MPLAKHPQSISIHRNRRPAAAKMRLAAVGDNRIRRLLIRRRGDQPTGRTFSFVQLGLRYIRDRSVRSYVR